MIQVSTSAGKYTFIITEQPKFEFKCLRYGGEWRDFVGDGAVMSLVQELDDARKLLKEIDEYLSSNKLNTVCSGSVFHQQIMDVIK